MQKTLLASLILIGAVLTSSLRAIDGNSSGGGTSPQFGQRFEGTFEGLRVSMQIASMPSDMSANWANLGATEKRGLSVMLPDYGSVKELRGDSPSFIGKVGKWTGIFVNASATGLADAKVIVRPVRLTSGPALLVQKLDGRSRIERIVCECREMHPGYEKTDYFVHLSVVQVSPSLSWIQQLVVGKYATMADCRARHRTDFAKYCLE